MYKKKLRRLGVACMTAAMVLTTVSFPGVAKAEEGTSTQADGVTSSELEKGKVLVQVDQNVLKANAMCNSEMNPAISWDSASGYTKNIDGQAEYVFDGDERVGTNSEKIDGGMWHSRYTDVNGGKFAGTTTAYSATVRGNEETISDTNRPWIGSGFGRRIMLKKVIYMGRYSATNYSNNIADYELYYANMDNQNEEPTASDWHLVKGGTFAKISGASDIELDTAVEATHFKLVGKTAYDGAGNKVGGTQYVCAREIKVYELKDIDINLTAPTNANSENASATTSEVNTEADTKDVSGSPATMSGAEVKSVNELDLSNPVTVTSTVGDKLDITGENGEDDSVLIQFQIKLKELPSNNHDSVIVAKGDQYKIAYRQATESNQTIYRIKFWITGPASLGNARWKEVGCNFTDKTYLNKWITVTAMYDGTSDTKLWIDGVSKSDGWNSNTAYRNNTGAAIVHEDANVMIGDSTGINGYIKDLKIYSHLGRTVTGNQNNYATLVSSLANDATEVFNLSATPAKKAAYTVSTKWNIGSNVDPETNASKKTYTETVTVTPAENASIVTAPEAVTVNIDGNTVNNKVVPVSEDSTLENGTATVKYVFEDMLRGGSLRMIKADGTVDYTKTSMRFGYDFQLPTDTDFASCEWYYGTTASDLKLSLAPGAATKKIENPTEKKQGYIRSNIVFTNIAKTNFDRDIYARVLVNYIKDGKTYSKMGAYVDQNSVKSISEKIRTNGSDTEKTYVENLTASN